MLGTQRLEDHNLSMRFMNSGANLRRAASTAERLIFSSSELSTCTALGAKPRPPSTKPFISAAPRFDVMMMMQLERSTRRLSPSVNVALSRIPSSNCHSESEAFRFRRTKGSKASACPCATG